MYPGLAAWWRQSSQCWEKNRSNARLSLSGQLDYMSKLSKQVPIVDIRVIYNKSGMHVVAAKVRDRRALIENGLYWAAASTEDEADYLCAILNAPLTTELARPFMSYGKDERDIEKHIWQLPVPEFNSGNETHVALAKLAREAQSLAEQMSIDPRLHFSASRRRLREALDQSTAMQQINEIVFELLS
jgi:hypothetical protein